MGRRVRFGISCLDWLRVSIRFGNRVRISWIFRVSSSVRFWIVGSFVVSPCWTISSIAPKREFKSLFTFLKSTRYCKILRVLF